MRRISILLSLLFIMVCFSFDGIKNISAMPSNPETNKEYIGCLMGTKDKKEHKGKPSEAEKPKEKSEETEKKHEKGPYWTRSDKEPPKIPGSPERVLKLDYRLHVSNIPGNAKTAYAWIPMPISNQHQTLIDYKVSGNWEYEIVKDRIFGNKFILINLKSNKQKKSSNAQVMVKYEVKRMSTQPIEKRKIRYDYDKNEMDRFLMPEKLVPLNDDLKNEATRIAGDEKGFSIQAKLIFDNIVATVKYDDSGFDLTRGDALKTMETRSGNCADCDSLFVGETRSLGIPSRLVAGISIPIGDKGEINAYYTWSEFFDADFGWLPVDIGNAIKQRDYHESYFGGLDSNRIQFSIGRGIILPKAKGDPVNFAIFPHVEIDGRIHKDIKYSISYQEVPGKGAIKSKKK